MKEFLEPVLKLQLFSVEDIITESAGNLEEEDNGSVVLPSDKFN